MPFRIYNDTDGRYINIKYKRKDATMRTFTACATAPATVATVVITTAIAVSICVSWNTRYKETMGSVIDAHRLFISFYIKRKKNLCTWRSKQYIYSMRINSLYSIILYSLIICPITIIFSKSVSVKYIMKTIWLYCNALF